MSRIGMASLDSRMSGAGDRVALKVEMAVSIVDLIALTSFQFAGGLGFAAANWDELTVSFANLDWTQLPRRLPVKECCIVPALSEIEACSEGCLVIGKWVDR